MESCVALYLRMLPLGPRHPVEGELWRARSLGRSPEFSWSLPSDNSQRSGVSRELDEIKMPHPEVEFPTDPRGSQVEFVLLLPFLSLREEEFCRQEWNNFVKSRSIRAVLLVISWWIRCGSQVGGALAALLGGPTKEEDPQLIHS